MDCVCGGGPCPNDLKFCCARGDGINGDDPACHGSHCNCQAVGETITFFAAGVCGTVFAVASGGRIELETFTSDVGCFHSFDVQNGAQFTADSSCGYDECAAVGFPS
tara:strand:+ start:327 stop:647 length:321 start_codon:yes stop_codon:yes gene_type:complete